MNAHTARSGIFNYLTGQAVCRAPRTADEAEGLLDAYRAEVRAEILGTDLNPSNLVLDAQSYRELADDILATMTAPDRWDLDGAEPWILTQYVQWLAAERATVRAEVLAEAADAIGPRCEEHGVLGVDALLRRMADEPGTDTPAPWLTVYRASHESIVMGLYTTAAAAREHCEAEERSSWPTGTTLAFDWIEDEGDGVAELVVVAGQNEESTTGYVVTALEVASAYDPEAEE